MERNIVKNNWFTVMTKKKYQKPTSKVYQIPEMKILAGTTGGDKPASARRFGSPWDDEE